MKNLEEATERICELKGGLVALDALVPALVGALNGAALSQLVGSFDAHAEAARTMLLHADISDVVLATFERDVARHRSLLQRRQKTARVAPGAAIEALLFATTRITTFYGSGVLTSASGFFFRRGERLFLVSNRHVFVDAESGHLPDRIEFGLHVDSLNLTQHIVVSLPLYEKGLSQWRDATDSGGAVDVAALEIPPGSLPFNAVLQAFDESHLEQPEEEITLGDALTIVGYPLGFYDTVHHLAVARSASVASAYGIRFQRQGCFLTDARTHRGSSGAPVVRRRMLPEGSNASALSWHLMGVHSTRMDMRSRDQQQDESLGLNCAWYADILLTLTGNAVAPAVPAAT